MQNDDPVFQDAVHALHVSYLIHSMPARQVSPTAVVIDMLVKQNRVWDELPPPGDRRVNFSGLSPLEVRAQCAQVVAMVNHLPHHAEASACRAIYGHQAIKASGVRAMALYLEPILKLSGDACLYVAWHVFMTPKQREGVTLSDIASKFGLTIESVRYAARAMRGYGVSLHDRAVSALTDRFATGGLIAAFIPE